MTEKKVVLTYEGLKNMEAELENLKTVKRKEVAEKIKKTIRDNKGVFDDTRKTEIAKELGDVMWYAANLAADLGISLDEIAAINVEKIKSRQNRSSIHGNGDNR